MRRQVTMRAFVAAMTIAMAAVPALAVIKIAQPVDSIYGTAAAVAVGKVMTVDAGKGVTASVETVLKGAFAPKSLTIDLAAVPEVAKAIKVGDAVVMMTARKGGAMIHVGDTWLVAASGASAAEWKVTADNGLSTGFPGRTAALAKVCEELKAGKKPMMGAYEHSSWVGKFDLGKLDGKPDYMRSADVNGDKNADLVVVSGGAAKLLLGTGPRAAFNDAGSGWGLAGAKGRRAAFGDVNGDGKPDLLLDTLWINDGGKFVPSKSAIDLAKHDVLAVALADLTGDKKPDAIVLTKTGALLVFENPGSTDRPWKPLPPKALWQSGDEAMGAEIADFYGDGTPAAVVTTDKDLYCYGLDGRPRDDFHRMTGQKHSDFMYRNKLRHYPLSSVGGYKGMLVLDVNGGDGRPDIWIIPGNLGVFTLHLINRGYGCYVWNGEGNIENGAAWTAADMYADGSQELLVATDKGQLFEIDSPPFYGSQVPSPPGKHLDGGPVPEPYDVQHGTAKP